MSTEPTIEFRTVTVHRADDGPDRCVIWIGDCVGKVRQSDDTPLTTAQLANLMATEANAVADVLYENLPVGVCHRVMLRLMERYSNVVRTRATS